MDVGGGRYELWVSTNSPDTYSKVSSGFDPAHPALPEHGIPPLTDRQREKLNEILQSKRTSLSHAEINLIIEARLRSVRIVGIAVQDGRLICHKCEKWLFDLDIEVLSRLKSMQ